MKQPKVAIILLNWNNYQDTIECLDSIKHITYKNYLVIVIDNGSTNASQSALKKYCHNETLVLLKENKGFTGGTNIGIQKASESNVDYYLLLNNDTIVSPDFLEILISSTDRDESVGIAGPLILHHKTSDVWFAGGKIDYKRGPFLHMHNPPISERNSSQYFVDYVNGCCMLIRKEVIDRIGKLDESYGSYVEDVDFNVRAREAGFRSQVALKSVIWHKVSASTGGGFSAKKEYLKAKNQVLFGKKRLKDKQRRLYFTLLLRNKVREATQQLLNFNYSVFYSIVSGTVNGFLK